MQLNYYIYKLDLLFVWFDYANSISQLYRLPISLNEIVRFLNFLFSNKMVFLVQEQLSSREIVNAFTGTNVSMAPWGSFQTIAACLFSSGFVIRIGVVAVKGFRGEATGSMINAIYDLVKVAAIFGIIRGINWPSILGIV